METISGATLFYKRILPMLQFIGLAFFCWQGGKNSIRDGELSPFIGVFILTCLLVGVLHWLLIWRLADTVRMSDDTLLVYSKGREVVIPFSHCDQVWYSRSLGPPRITVTLRGQTPIGDKFTFLTPMRAFDWFEHPLAEELRERIAQATGP